MVEKLDYNEVNQMIKEFFKFHGLDQALETFQAEERTKYYNNKNSKSNQLNTVPQVSNRQIAIRLLFLGQPAAADVSYALPNAS